MSKPIKILFLDGIGGDPDGRKPTHLRGLGHEVAAPRLPDLDFPAAVEIAERAFAESRPDVIVGYSRGASVAMTLDARDVPRVLIAASLRSVPDGHGCDAPVIALHSTDDEFRTVDEAREALARCGLASAKLVVVGKDHAMIDPEALEALARAVEKLGAGGGGE